ncbi:MAG: uridine diphosphate-N-acetylglucosamine-binding protein YvcK [Actinomycetota bacterium]
MSEGGPARPHVVAIGGGHGLANVLRAVCRYAGTVTAIVTVADDGGSSGRLRRDLGIVPPGDLRKAIVAMADEDALWSRTFEHRFDDGELAGHAVGNLVLAALFDTTGDVVTALDEAGRLVGSRGRALPATTEAVVLTADIDGQEVEGQVAVATAPGRIRRVRVAPADVRPVPDAVAALVAADQVVLAPGSLYTSVLAVLVVEGLAEAVRMAPGRVVQVGNLRTQDAETSGLDAGDHLQAVLDHGGRVDVYLAPESGALAVDVGRIRTQGAEAVTADVAAPGAVEHDPHRLALALAALL